jgi:hypothetical protein
VDQRDKKRELLKRRSIKRRNKYSSGFSGSCWPLLAIWFQGVGNRALDQVAHNYRPFTPEIPLCLKTSKSLHVSRLPYPYLLLWFLFPLAFVYSDEFVHVLPVLGHATPTPLDMVQKGDEMKITLLTCTSHIPTQFLLEF